MICHRKENQNCRKLLTEFIVLIIIDGIKIKLIRRFQFKVNERVYAAR